MQRSTRKHPSWILVLVLILGFAAACAPEEDPEGEPDEEADTDTAFEMPDTVVWTAYDVGSAGYSQSASIGHAMGGEGITLRVIPGGNDVARQSPLLGGRAHFGALGIASFLSQEGVMEFSETEWGPQSVRILGAAWADFNTGIASCAGDVGIATVDDLEGKRLAWVVGAPALNLNMTSFLAAADLTWDDVERVEFPSFGAATRAALENQVDCYVASTNSGNAVELSESPRGFQPAHLPRPEEDPDAWDRLLSEAPYWEFNEATIGADPVSEEEPHIGSTYGYPIITTYDVQDPGLVYEQARLIYELLPEYEDAYPGNDGFALEAQRFEWVMPYHEGAVRYFEEQGVWTDEMEAHNQALIERQEVLAAAYDRALSELEEEQLTAEEFPDLWMEIRAEELTGAGFEPYWEDVFW
ncbi:MAG: TAXI family TRAP transporter solute-binding subunit [Nitriliruptorales bacterium]|nr:TAXI family TRAP transporter solute-binding subunit [Nitriliruptorales bacterium]